LPRTKKDYKEIFEKIYEELSLLQSTLVNDLSFSDSKVDSYIVRIERAWRILNRLKKSILSAKAKSLRKRSL